MRRTRSQVLEEFRTGEILAAATRLFSERGFSGTTVEDIAQAAGVAKGTVYLYFPSKERVFQAAFGRNILELKARGLAALEREGSVEDKVRAFIRAKLDYFEENRPFFAVYFSEIRIGPREDRVLQETIDDAYCEQVDALAKLLTHAMGAGLLRPMRPRAVATAIFDLTRSTVIQRMRGWSDASSEDDAALIFDLLWKGLATP